MTFPNGGKRDELHPARKVGRPQDDGPEYDDEPRPDPLWARKPLEKMSDAELRRWESTW